MPNDAKLGLVVGVGLVLTVAVIFFRKDLITRKPNADPAAASTIGPVKAPPAASPRGLARPARARPASRVDGAASGEPRQRQEGPGHGVDDQSRPEQERQSEQH